MLLPSRCRKVCHPAPVLPLPGDMQEKCINIQGWAEQSPEHGHEDTWVPSRGCRKVILGKPCPAGEVRVKGVEQSQHLP